MSSINYRDFGELFEICFRLDSAQMVENIDFFNEIFIVFDQNFDF